MADTRQDGKRAANALIVALFILCYILFGIDLHNDSTIRSLRQQLSQPCEGRK